MKHRIAVAMMVWIFLWAGQVHAGSVERPTGWYVSLAYQFNDIDMESEYLREFSGVLNEHAFFDDTYQTGAESIKIGYKIPYNRFRLAGSIFFSLYNDEFSLSAGSSRFTYRLNHDFGVEVTPGVYLSDRWLIYVKGAVQVGDFDFEKASPTSTTYDVNTSLAGYTLGLGVGIDLSERITLNIGYDRIQFDGEKIVAVLGIRTDTTWVRPDKKVLYIDIQYHF